MSLKLRTLGRTGLKVSPIGLGLAALGRPGYINLGHAEDLEGEYHPAAMEKRAHDVLDAAWEAGVRYFDAARSYGQAEAFLGSWLTKRAIDPREVTVGSKWGYTYTAEWRVEAERHEVKEHSLPVLQRQWRESLSLLRDHLDLYQIHSATIESGVLDNRDVLAELARLKGEGMCLGLSLSGPRQVEALRKAMGVVFDGARLFDSVQATWNLLEPSAASALEEAHAAGMGIIIKEALANGRLTDRNRDQSFANGRAILQREAARLSTSLDALALSSALARPWADVVLSGAVTIDQLHSNLAALGVAWDEEADSRLAALAESSEMYWKTRSELAWN